MTMSNLDNAVDLIRLVSRLGMDVQVVIDVIDGSSGGSTHPAYPRHRRDPEIAPHIQGLMRKDIEHFADAIRAYGLDPPVAARPRPGRRQRPSRGRRTARGRRRALTSGLTEKKLHTHAGDHHEAHTTKTSTSTAAR